MAQAMGPAQALPHLGNAVVLQIDDPRDRHLDAPKNSHHFKLLVVEGGSSKILEGRRPSFIEPNPGMLPSVRFYPR